MVLEFKLTSDNGVPQFFSNMSGTGIAVIP
jgi:hypothetical protein